jgi:fibronectin-binding autotransporter adhesin
MTIDTNLGASSIVFNDAFNASNTAVIGSNSASPVVLTLDSGWTVGDIANSGQVTFQPFNGGSGALSILLNGSGSVFANPGTTVRILTNVAQGASGNGVTELGGGTVELGGVNTYTGPITVQAGTLNITGSVAGNVVIQGGTLIGTGTVNGTVSIMNDGQFKVSNATFTVNGMGQNGGSVYSGDFSGNTAGSTTLTNATLIAAGNYFQTGGTTTVDGSTLNAGFIAVNSGGSNSGNLDVRNSSTINASLFNNSGLVTMSNSIVNGDVFNGRGFTVDGTVKVNGNLTQFGGLTVGDGVSHSELDLGSGNTFDDSSGTTTISKGSSINATHFLNEGEAETKVFGTLTADDVTVNASLLFGSNGTFGNTTAPLTVNGDVDLGRTSQTVGALNGSGRIENIGDFSDAGDNRTSTLTVGNGDATGTFAGSIIDHFGNFTGITALTKIGSGTETLSGNNTFTGDTNVNGGTLEAAAAGALGGTGNVTVNAAGRLLLTGQGNLDRINDAATITLAGGTFARGGMGAVSEGAGASRNGAAVAGMSSVGLGSLVLQANSILNFGTDGVGTFTFASFTPGLNVLDIMNWTSNASAPLLVSGVDGTDDRLIFHQDQIANLAFFSFNGIPATELALDSGYFEILPDLAAVPEPATWLAGSLILVTLLATQRRRVMGFVPRD